MEWVIARVDWTDGSACVVQVPDEEDSTEAIERAAAREAERSGRTLAAWERIDRAAYAAIRENLSPAGEPPHGLVEIGRFKAAMDVLFAKGFITEAEIAVAEQEAGAAKR